MLINVTVKTVAEIRPEGKVLTTNDLYELAKTVAGVEKSIEIDDAETVQKLADKMDEAMSVDPAITILETIIDNGVALNNTDSLAAAGVKNGDVVTYSYVIKA